MVDVDGEGKNVDKENINVAKEKILSTNSQSFVNRGIAGAY